MAVILTDTFTVPADETPAFSNWAEIDPNTVINVSVTVMNNQSPDLWVQWADDTDNPGESLDEFRWASDPDRSDGDNYHVEANGLASAGTYIRVMGVAYGTAAGPCRVVVNTA